MRKALGFILVSLGISMAVIFILQREVLPKDLEAYAIGKIWQEDVRRLEEAKQLPKSWWQIRTLKIQPLSPKAAKWLQNISPPIRYQAQGRYLLEVSLDSHSDKESIAAILHYVLIDIKSGNTVWEFGRTMKIPNKKWLHLGDKILAWFKNPFPNQTKYSTESPSHRSDHSKDHNDTQN